MIKSNFHTHSTYCDGCDDVESIVLSAIEKQFKYLGFSSHSYIEGDDSWTLKIDSFYDYVNEVLRVKEKYKNKITILLGIEQDCLSNQYDYNFDYVIGSMHSIIKDEKKYSLDLSPSSFLYLLENIYLNDFDKLCRDYFNQIKEVGLKTNADVIGHFDLITKYVEILKLKLPNNYLAYAEEAVKCILKNTSIFEINTGAMAKSYRTSPYPSKEILNIIYKNNGEIMINSDCHKKEQLDFAFDTAVNIAKEVGFKEHIIFTNNGKEKVDL